MNLSTLLGLKRAQKPAKPVQTVSPAIVAATPVVPAASAPVAKTVDPTPRHKQETADCPLHFCIYALCFGCPLCAQDDYHNTFGTQFEGPYVHSQMEEIERREDAPCPS